MPCFCCAERFVCSLRRQKSWPSLSCLLGSKPWFCCCFFPFQNSPWWRPRPLSPPSPLRHVCLHVCVGEQFALLCLHYSNRGYNARDVSSGLGIIHQKKTKSNKNKYTFRYLHSEIVGMIDPCFILSSEFG